MAMTAEWKKKSVAGVKAQEEEKGNRVQDQTTGMRTTQREERRHQIATQHVHTTPGRVAVRAAPGGRGRPPAAEVATRVTPGCTHPSRHSRASATRGACRAATRPRRHRRRADAAAAPNIPAEGSGLPQSAAAAAAVAAATSVAGVWRGGEGSLSACTSGTRRYPGTRRCSAGTSSPASRPRRPPPQQWPRRAPPRRGRTGQSRRHK